MDNSFWAFAALLIFLALMFYLKVPAMMGKGLDDRAAKIKSDLDEARRLRDEAKALLDEYTKRRKEAVGEAQAIVDAAKREADQIAADAKVKSEDYVRRRTAIAEQKISQAEAEAVNAVRGSAVDLAIAASTKLLQSKGKAGGTDLFKDALAQVKSRLN